MGILSWIIVGIIAGWLAGETIHETTLGSLSNLLVGGIGGLLGGIFASTLFNIPDSILGMDVVSIVVAFLGAVVLLALVQVQRRIGL